MGYWARIVVALAALAAVASAGSALADSDRAAPGVAAAPASGIAGTVVVLRGYVHPRDQETTYYFEYGPSASYASRTASESAEQSDEWQPVSTLIEGLAPLSTYHYRLVATNRKGTSRGPDRTFTTLDASADGSPSGEPTQPPTLQDGVPGVEPSFGSSVAVAPARGVVLVRPAGGKSFEPLTEGAEVPLGSEVDTRHGSVRLTSALPSGDAQTGRFGGGRFVPRQGRRGYIDLHLRGAIGRCPTTARNRGRGSRSAAAAGRAPGRRLWGRDRGGRFRTHGKHSHATVRGTRWLVADRCDGTLTRVTEGAVVVRDKTNGRRVTVQAGERYLARPRD